MNLLSGFPLLLQQFFALFQKNYVLAWRHKRATLMQILASFFFILIMFCIDKVTEHGVKPDNPTSGDPQAMISPRITPCEENSVIFRRPCYDFIWSGDGNQRIKKIVEGIMKKNPGRQIPSGKVKAFETKEQVDDWLFDNPLRCPGALHFVERNASVISYGIQTSAYHDPLDDDVDKALEEHAKFQIILQLAAEREIARDLTGDQNFKWEMGLKEFAHPAELPVVDDSDLPNNEESSISSIGPTFFLASAMFSFIFQIGNLVTEKELKLRQAMSMMGLYDSAYWLSWLIWEGFMSLASSLCLVLFGMMFQFDFFLKNSFLLLFLLFFLFQLSMTCFAFILSTMISKSSSSTATGFGVFIVGFLLQNISFTDEQSTASIIIKLWSLFPPNLLFHGLSLLELGDGAGVTWAGRKECPQSHPNCVMKLHEVYKLFASFTALFFVLAVYFDNIIPDAGGIRKSVLYFLDPGYWIGCGGSATRGGVCSSKGSVPAQEYTPPEDEDVLEEETLVKKQSKEEGTVDPNVAVQIQGLVKTYPGTTRVHHCCCCCCKCKRTAPFHAVMETWLNVEKNKLFCLLGPNGAGKTTIISCLTGILPLTSGDALIHGHSIRSSLGMAKIRKIIGVCPQFDTLWDALTGEEHLYLFANIKGVAPCSTKSVVERLLAETRLSKQAKIRAGSYSGGMKRRLSFSIALIGDPKLVILDEPTTGMDPITRRHVWNMIENAKKGRAIILTTHSMEEADILGDRIGIVAKGRLRCLGTSIRLKTKFGTGILVTTTFSGSNNYQSRQSIGDVPAAATSSGEAVKQFFRENLNVEPKEESKSFLTFVIPRDREPRLTMFFSELQNRQNKFGIADIQISLATLEQVFLNIAIQAEVQDSKVEGKLVTLTLRSGVSVEIPVGARFVAIPEIRSAEHPGGIAVEVYWEADESNGLRIVGHSSEYPITSCDGHFTGIVIDPSQTGATRISA